jgi:hypothetical protein
MYRDLFNADTSTAERKRFEFASYYLLKDDGDVEMKDYDDVDEDINKKLVQKAAATDRLPHKTESSDQCWASGTQVPVLPEWVGQMGTHPVQSCSGKY